MTHREFSSPHSLSSTAAPMRWTAILVLLVSHALVGRTSACSVTVNNAYDQALSLVVFNGWDSSCDVYYALYTIGAGGSSTSIVYSRAFPPCVPSSTN